jgi:dihydroxyacetone kinase-like protein
MRAGMTAGTAEDLTGEQAVAMLRAAVEGIKARGQSDVGDKTLLDSLVPFTDMLESRLQAGDPPKTALAAAAAECRRAADATATMVAKRGRAAYTGERSKGSVDAGATALAVLAEQLAAVWPEGKGIE